MVTSDMVLKVLNEALKADKDAVNGICQYRVPCNEELAFHPTIQVKLTRLKRYEVGFIGILNGILEEAGEPKISMVIDDTGELIGFQEYN